MRCKSVLMGLLLVCVTMVGAVTLTLVPATAQAGTDIDLLCPTTIVPGAKLNLGLGLKKESGASFATHFTKTALAIHVGNMSIIGPSVVPINVTLTDSEPVDTCPDSDPSTSCPYYFATQTITNYFSTSMGRATRGTIISVGVAILDSSNKPTAKDWCNIEVL